MITGKHLRWKFATNVFCEIRRLSKQTHAAAFITETDVKDTFGCKDNFIDASAYFLIEYNK